MNKKLLIGIGIAAILVILAALLGKYIGYNIGYERAIKEGVNKDWKTYHNEELGFEFRYPEGASILQKSINNSGRIGPRNGDLLSIEIDKISFDIFKAENYKLSGPGGWVYWNEDLQSWMLADSYNKTGKPYDKVTKSNTSKGLTVYDIPFEILGVSAINKAIVKDDKVFVYSASVAYEPDDEASNQSAVVELQTATELINEILDTLEFK